MVCENPPDRKLKENAKITQRATSGWLMKERNGISTCDQLVCNKNYKRVPHLLYDLVPV